MISENEKMKDCFTFKELLQQGFLPILLISVTLFWFGPIEIYFSNFDEFWFSIIQVIPLFSIVTGFSVVCLYGLLFLANRSSKKTANLFLIAVFSCGIASYLQGNFMFVDYGTLDGSDIDWSSFQLWAVANTLIWIFLFAVPFYLYFRNKNLFQLVYKNVPVFVLGIQMVTLGTLFLAYGAEKNKEIPVSTTLGQFELSQEENIVVFLLDTLDIHYMYDVLDEYPEVAEILKDFTFYDNVVGAYPMSRETMPFLYTGIPYLNETTYNEYKNLSYEQSGIFETLIEEEYDINIYTNSNYIGENIVNYTENIQITQLYLGQEPQFLKDYFSVVFFRYVPHILKQYVSVQSLNFYHYARAGDNNEVYSFENYDFYDSFLETSLSAEAERKQFKFYYLMGSHSPLNLNENMERVDLEETSVTQQTRGCLKMVDEYLNEMKELGVYDKTTVIILADHGFLLLRQCPAVLIKTLGANQETLEISSASLSYLEDWGNTMQQIIDPQGEYGTTFFNVADEDVRVREFYTSLSGNVWYQLDAPEMDIISSEKHVTEFTEDDALSERISGYKNAHN